MIAHIHVPKTAGTSFRTLLENRFGADHSNLYVDDTYFVYSESEIEAHIADRPSLRSLSSHFIRTYPSRVAGREMLYVTFLRNPVEMFISYLTYTKKFYDKIPDLGLLDSLPARASEMPLREIARWVLSEPRDVPFRENYLVNYFARHSFFNIGGAAGDDLYRPCRLVLAQTVLSQFYFVGITERMDESVDRIEALGEKYGIEMPGGPIQRENVSSEFRDDLRWIDRSDEVGSMLLASLSEDLKLYDWALARFDQHAAKKINAPEKRAADRPVSIKRSEAKNANQRFVTQLFWRFEDGGFSEEQSIQRYWAAGTSGSQLRMRLPRFDRTPAQMRLDLTDRPMLLRVSGISFVNSAGELIWGLDLDKPERLEMAGMTIGPAEPGPGVLVTVENQDPAILLPIDGDSLRRLSTGASLEISMCGLDSVEVDLAGSLPAERPGEAREPFTPTEATVAFNATTASGMYLELLERCLTRLLFPDSCVDEQLQPTGFFDPEARSNGKDWPSEADTMIGLRRLENLEECAVAAIKDKIPGDFVEAGVWRGGASILLRAVLKVFRDLERRVWVVDSFEGLPDPDVNRYPADGGEPLSRHNEYLGVSLERVQANFAKYGLLDDQVRFLKGWFKDTLPAAPIERIALLRLDGDLYESTMDVLNNLYWKVSPGGFVIVDDYGALPSCRAAIHDFRERHQITEDMVPIDWSGVYWKLRA